MYENEIWQLVEALSHNYLLFSECRYLPTKSKMYRWIILDSHLVIYRITLHEVHVLQVIHASRAINTIKSSRKIKI
ncbi:MAG: type II toxin-antitoxin system RelE/ParE family toxin [Breznakibacter sp.]|nr:type II toxin-antitoxin system RelE/ParE family toxin [Breznakibacter sp.]